MAFYDLDVRFPVKREAMAGLGFSDFRMFSGSHALAESQSVDALRQAAKGRKAKLLLMSSFQADVGLLRDAKQEGKAFVFPISMLLRANGIERGKLMSRMAYLLKLCVQLGAHYVLASGARNEYELKSPEELVVIGEALGLSRDQALWAISETPKLFL